LKPSACGPPPQRDVAEALELLALAEIEQFVVGEFGVREDGRTHARVVATRSSSCTRCARASSPTSRLERPNSVLLGLLRVLAGADVGVAEGFEDVGAL